MLRFLLEIFLTFLLVSRSDKNGASLVTDLILYFNEREFMLSLKSDTQVDIIEAFNNTSRYLDDIFNIDNQCFILYFLSYTLFPFIYTPCGVGTIIHPLLETVMWCKPIKHRHALTHIHTAYSPALFDGLVLCHSVMYSPWGLGGD